MCLCCLTFCNTHCFHCTQMYCWPARSFFKEQGGERRGRLFFLVLAPAPRPWSESDHKKYGVVKRWVVVVAEFEAPST